MKNIKIITKPGELLKMLELWEEESDAMPFEMFIEYIPGEQITACDNRDGDAWCEDFDTLEEAVNWLLEL